MIGVFGVNNFPINSFPWIKLDNFLTRQDFLKVRTTIKISRKEKKIVVLAVMLNYIQSVFSRWRTNKNGVTLAEIKMFYFRIGVARSLLLFCCYLAMNFMASINWLVNYKLTNIPFVANPFPSLHHTSLTQHHNWFD